MFIKLGKICNQRMRLNLPSSKPSGSSCSRYGSSGSGSRYCLANSSTGSPSFTPVSTAHTNKQTINKKKEIKVLPLSSNQKKFRYEDRKNIFGRFSNGTAGSISELAWSSFEITGGFLVHEMISYEVFRG